MNVSIHMQKGLWCLGLAPFAHSCNWMDHGKVGFWNLFRARIPPPFLKVGFWLQCCAKIPPWHWVLPVWWDSCLQLVPKSHCELCSVSNFVHELHRVCTLISGVGMSFSIMTIVLSLQTCNVLSCCHCFSGPNFWFVVCSLRSFSLLHRLLFFRLSQFFSPCSAHLF